MPGQRTYLVDNEGADLEPRPLFLCLGDPGGCDESAESVLPGGLVSGVDADGASTVADSVDLPDGTWLCEDDADSECSSDEE